MKQRKLIAHGPSSLTICLPSKWLKKHGLLKGDTVYVEVDENDNLEVSPSPRGARQSISVNLSGYDAPEIFTILTTIYRRGYDEVYVQYATSSEYQALAAAIRQLLGYAIVEHKSNHCTIHQLSEGEFSDFRSLFRRVFFVLLQELDDLSRIIVTSKELATFSRRDEDINILVNLALRLINKGYVPSRFHELHLYHALLQLEELGDDLLRFSIELRENKFDVLEVKKALKACKEMLQLLSDQFFENKGNIGEFYKYYYLYDSQHPLFKQGDAPKPTVYEMFKEDNSTLLFYPRSFVEKVVALAETLLLPPIKEAERVAPEQWK